MTRVRINIMTCSVYLERQLHTYNLETKYPTTYLVDTSGYTFYVHLLGVIKRIES